MFSYAMQYWNADPYTVHVFYHNELTQEEELLVDYLSSAATGKEFRANLEVRLVDLNTTEDASAVELHRVYLSDMSGGLLVQYPAATWIADPVYAGPLTRAALKGLVDSPARRELVRRLLRGDMAVWILLESGNRREDNQAAQLIEQELERMSRVLQLPEDSLWVWSDALDPKAGIRFSLLRISRNGPDEEMFVRMLLESEPDLAERDPVPMAFPVYGRGLVLYALVGAGINEWTIAEACEFVIGPCSCQVKASNPGTDLLISGNWDALIKVDPYQALPAATGLADFFERGEAAAERIAALSTGSIEASHVQPERKSKVLGWFWYPAFALLLFTAILVVWFGRCYLGKQKKE